jgi:hypothetical protein
VWVVALEAGMELWFGPLEKKTVPQSTWSFKLPRQSQEFRQLSISKTIQNNLRFDEGTTAEWRDPGGRAWKLFYLRWLPAVSGYTAVSADAQQMGHGEVCLVGGGMVLQTNLGIQSLVVNGVGIAVGTQRYLSRGRNFHVCSVFWKAGLANEDLIPELSSGFAVRFVYRALRTRDRGRNEQRSILLGVWEMETDEEAQAAFREYLAGMIGREEAGGKAETLKTESRKGQGRSGRREAEGRSQ